MTSAPDPDDSPRSDRPRDPADQALRRPGPPASFWIMILFGFVCIAAGAVVGLFGARLFAPKPAAQSPATIGQVREAWTARPPFVDQLAALGRILPDSAARRGLRPQAPLATRSHTAPATLDGLSAD